MHAFFRCYPLCKLSQNGTITYKCAPLPLQTAWETMFATVALRFSVRLCCDFSRPTLDMWATFLPCGLCSAPTSTGPSLAALLCIPSRQFLLTEGFACLLTVLLLHPLPPPCDLHEGRSHFSQLLAAPLAPGIVRDNEHLLGE